ncbi:MAG: hypothetical protein A07HR60_00463 [uncultured archaeon A07HR60]|nr:MAG: hypothetical protein A07HR60_00463 [uncultured archaeon A07HR60]
MALKTNVEILGHPASFSLGVILFLSAGQLY